MGITTFALLMRNKALLQAAGSDERAASFVGRSFNQLATAKTTIRTTSRKIRFPFHVGLRATGPGTRHEWTIASPKLLCVTRIVRQTSAASKPQARIIAATASSANQLTSKTTMAPGINFFFMAISRITDRCSGPRPLIICQNKARRNKRPCSTTEATVRSPYELAIRNNFGISHNPTPTQLFP